MAISIIYTTIVAYDKQLYTTTNKIDIKAIDNNNRFLESLLLKSIVLLFPTLSVADNALHNIFPSLTKGNRIAHCDNTSCGIKNL